MPRLTFLISIPLDRSTTTNGLSMTKKYLGIEAQNPEEIVFSLQKVEELCLSISDYEAMIFAAGGTPRPTPAVMPPITTQEQNAVCLFWTCKTNTSQGDVCELVERTLSNFQYYWDAIFGYSGYETREECCEACPCDCQVWGTTRYSLVKSDSTVEHICCGPNAVGYVEGSLVGCKCKSGMPDGSEMYNVCLDSSTPVSNSDCLDPNKVAQTCCPPTMVGVVDPSGFSAECACENSFDVKQTTSAGDICCGQATYPSKIGGVQASKQLVGVVVNGNPKCACPEGRSLTTFAETGDSICCPEGYTASLVNGQAVCLGRWYCGEVSEGCIQEVLGATISSAGYTFELSGSVCQSGKLESFSSEEACLQAGCKGYWCMGTPASGCVRADLGNFICGTPESNIPIFDDEAQCEQNCGKFFCATFTTDFQGAITQGVGDCKEANQSTIDSNFKSMSITVYPDTQMCEDYCENKWVCENGQCVSVPQSDPRSGFFTPEQCCVGCSNCGKTNCGGAEQPPCCPDGYEWNPVVGKCIKV